MQIQIRTQILVTCSLPEGNILMDNRSDLVHECHCFGLEVLDDKVEVVNVAEAHDGHHPE